jgi:hypothetical protein
VPSTCLHVLHALVEGGFAALDEQKENLWHRGGVPTLVR